jgi:hypothetical protein
MERSPLAEAGQEPESGFVKDSENYSVAVALPDSVDITGLLRAWGQGDQLSAQIMRRILIDAARAQARRRSAGTLMSHHWVPAASCSVPFGLTFAIIASVPRTRPRLAVPARMYSRARCST